MPESEYGHILSFRRQIYIIPIHNESNPYSILIPFENDSHSVSFNWWFKLPAVSKSGILWKQITIYATTNSTFIPCNLATALNNHTICMDTLQPELTISQTLSTNTEINEEPIETLPQPQTKLFI